MDGRKVFAKAEKEIKRLTATVEMISKDAGMEFGFVKSVEMIVKRGKSLM